MTRTANARIAGFTFLFYIAAGITSLTLSSGTTRAKGVAAVLAAMAQHTTTVRVGVLLSLLTSFCALVLGVTLYAITREQDPDLALMALVCRVIEGVSGIVFIPWTLALLWLATATGGDAPDTATAHALGALVLNTGGNAGATFFVVASTIFSWLFLRGRMIPAPLAWLGVVASAPLVVVLPLQLARLPGSTNWFSAVTWLTWFPLLIFEVTLAVWFLVRGVATPVRNQRT